MTVDDFAPALTGRTLGPLVGFDDGRLELLYRSEADDLVRMAAFFTGSKNLAEDAVHDCFIKLHARLDEVDNPKTFLRKAVVNRCIDITRSETRRRRRSQLFHPDHTDEAGKHYLFDVLMQLSPTRRFILVLKFYGGHTLREIADILDLAEGTVRSNYGRGLDELRALLPNEAEAHHDQR